MAKLNDYTGSIELIAGIIQKSGGDFALVEANAVQTRDDGTRLDTELTAINSHISDTIGHITDVERNDLTAAKTHAESEHAPVDAEKNTITGIKGDAETSYRIGNINLTPANIGAIAVNLKGAANGVAELDDNGKILSAQLPSYVDEVLEGYYFENKFYYNESHEPEAAIACESGKIYVDISTNKTYRWSGSTFAEISSSLSLGETASTAYRGDWGKAAYDHSQVPHAPAVAEENQNAFSNIIVGETAIAADTPTDSLTLVAGDNITIVPDDTNNKITITATNTTYTTATATDSGLTKLYSDTGNNADGTMTQSAITAALEDKEASGAAAAALSSANNYTNTKIDSLISCGTSDPSADLTSQFYFKYSIE